MLALQFVLALTRKHDSTGLSWRGIQERLYSLKPEWRSIAVDSTELAQELTPRDLCVLRLAREVGIGGAGLGAPVDGSGPTDFRVAPTDFRVAPTATAYTGLRKTLENELKKNCSLEAHPALLQPMNEKFARGRPGKACFLGMGHKQNCQAHHDMPIYERAGIRSRLVSLHARGSSADTTLRLARVLSQKYLAVRVFGDSLGVQILEMLFCAFRRLGAHLENGEIVLWDGGGASSEGGIKVEAGMELRFPPPRFVKPDARSFAKQTVTYAKKIPPGKRIAQAVKFHRDLENELGRQERGRGQSDEHVPHLYVFNGGTAHYNSLEGTFFALDTRAHLRWLSTLVRKRPGSAAILRGSFAQHFPTPSGEFNYGWREWRNQSADGASGFTCRRVGEPPFDDFRGKRAGYGRYPDWKDIETRRIFESMAEQMENSSIWFLPLGNLTRPLWDAHIGDIDCTHFCSAPFLFEPIWWALTTAAEAADVVPRPDQAVPRTSRASAAATSAAAAVAASSAPAAAVAAAAASAAAATSATAVASASKFQMPEASSPPPRKLTR